MAAVAPQLSIVVAARNASGTLGACLAAACAKTDQEVEVIVVDDCSTDSTTTVASQFPVRLIEFDTHRGVAATRNAGALAARAPLLTFIDADVVPIGDLFAREFSLHRCGLQSDPVDSACTRDQKPAQRPEPQLAPAVSSFSGCRRARSFAVHAVLASDATGGKSAERWLRSKGAVKDL